MRTVEKHDHPGKAYFCALYKSCYSFEVSDLTPELLLDAYANGYFPMALSAADPELYWFSPEERGVLPLDTFNIPRGLKRAMKNRPYTITVDQAFEQVIRSCGMKTETRDETWINEPIIALYTELHRMGYAHSIEVWQAASEAEDTLTQSSTSRVVFHGEGVSGSEGDASPSSRLKLIGGLYGISLGGAFFGESMFSRAPDASKIALVKLVQILRDAGV